MSPNHALSEPNTCVEGAVVRVKGLPPKASNEDVVAFFEGKIRPEAVHFVSKEKRSAGEALVEFGSLQEAQQACSKDKDIFSPTKFGDRYVRVLLVEEVSPADLRNSAGTASNPKVPRNGRRSHSEAETVAKVGGLPPGITLQELLQLFWGLQAKPASTHIIAGNGVAAEAYVNFETQEHALQAVSTRNGTMMTTATGMYQLTVQRVSKGEWEDVVASRQRCDGIIRLKGLPTKASANDVLAFFEGFDVKKGGVHVQPQSENRHSKVAFVEFVTPEEAARALSRDRQRFGEAFGDRYCLLQLVTRQEMEQARQQFCKPGGSSSSTGGTGPSCTSGAGQGSPMMSSMLGSLGMLPPAGFPPAAAAGSYFGMPNAMGLMSQSMTAPPPAPAAFGMPHFPGFGMGHGAGGVMLGHHPGLAHLAAAGAQPSAVAAPGLGVQGLSWGGPAAARYMVQDLSTGQRVFLDPRFNVSFNPTDMSGAGIAPWLQAQSQQSQSMSLSEQSKGGQQLAAEPHTHGMFPPFSMHGLGITPLEGQLMAAPAPDGQDGSGGSSNTGNGNGSGSGSGSDRGADGSDGEAGGSGGSSGGSGTNMPPPGPTATAALVAAAGMHLPHHHHQQLPVGLLPPKPDAPTHHHLHHHHHLSHAHRAHPHVHHPHVPHQALKHAASRSSTNTQDAAAQMDVMLQPLQKRCRSQE